jgi:hypothetical protein
MTPNFGHLVVIQLSDILSINKDGSRSRSVETTNEIEKSGLPRARGSDNSNELTSVHFEISSLQNFDDS